MLELAVKAKLPLIAISTEDLLNYRQVIAEVTGSKIVLPPKTINLMGESDSLIVTDSFDYVTPEWYKRLTELHRSMVIVNPSKPSPLLFDAGILPTPPKMVKDYLDEVLGAGVDTEELVPCLKGLSLKAVGEVVMLTKARAKVVPHELRRTRGMISTSIQGFTPLDTTYDFYEASEDLTAWLNLNAKYFTSPVSQKLTPRGILFEGPPGTGKSLAAKVIANRFGCSLYRLDVATVLDRFVGASETRVAKILSMCEREAPCVLLIDEVEKLFGEDGDSGVTTRILSQLLWWLSEHQSQVFTVMTTNDASKLPSELYRPGRMDTKMFLGKLQNSQLIPFAGKVLQSVLGAKPTVAQTKHLKEVLETKNGQQYSQMEVTNMVITEVKRKGWM